ncbi:LuxR C-terminal-related transcriptional regulator [Microvirga tunisiensis]|uniref:Response regulator transcription factor n=1 Tax=Microvirga tunisiensis TaxID=2108360 RepID=A0A5N7MWS8_9HYPH|nr:response regulator transcription factor [Microvirga tunisiensis]MPR13277.1 response regulator transcription factor [Microvirga tunisiensis]MPR31150.1 response regulator transcription factor [Microvirga tunisiensis]
MAAQTLTLENNRSFQSDFALTGLTPAIPTALICDNSLLRSGLQRILSGSPFAIAEVPSPIAGSRRFQKLIAEAALVLIQASQNTSRVLEMVKQVREQCPEARIIVLADKYDLDLVRLGHEAGVDGFCLTATAPEVLIKSFELVMLGESVLPFEVLRSIMDAAPQNRDQPLQDDIAEPRLSDLSYPKLSAREAQILGCLREGAPNKVIARKLDITEATIKVHVKAILRKIGAANRTQAAMWASQRLPRTGIPTLNV